MKKICLFPIIIFFNCTILFCQINYERIFAIDISKSMKKNGLDEKVKKAARDLIVDCRVGDRIILMTFGTDVNAGYEDRTFAEDSITRDKEEVIGNINKLKFNDDYTWMTKAFDIIGKRLKDLQKAYPNKPKRVYVFTDGLNDPPPQYKDALTFEEILKSHFDNYNNPNTFIYLIAIDVQPDNEIKNFISKSRGTITPTSQTKELLFREIRFYPSSYNGELDFSNNANFDISLELTSLINVKEEKINFILKDTDIPETAKISISPSEILCSKVGEKYNLTIKLEDLPYIDKLKIDLMLEPFEKDVIVDPAIFSINMSFKSKVVKVLPKDLKLKLNYNKKVGAFNLNFENQNSEIVPAIISIKNVEKGKKLLIKPENFEIKQGKSRIDFLIEYENFSEGKYNYELLLISDKENIKIEPNILKLGILFYKPMSIYPLIFISLLLFFLILLFLYFYFINKLFQRWELYIDNVPSKILLHKKFFSDSFICDKNTDERVEEKLFLIFGNIKSIFNKKLFIKSLIDLGNDMKANQVLELNDFSTNYKGLTIEIKKEVL